MANLSLIRDLCGEKKITLKDLADAISISQNGLQRIIKENSTKIDTLEKIANYFNVPVTYFFRSEYENDFEESFVKCKKQIETFLKDSEEQESKISKLEKQLEDKEKIINLLEDKMNNLIKTGAVSIYNLTTPKEKRGLSYSDLNDINELLNDFNKSKIDLSNQEEYEKFIKAFLEKKVKDEKLKKE